MQLEDTSLAVRIANLPVARVATQEGKARSEPACRLEAVPELLRPVLAVRRDDHDLVVGELAPGRVDVGIRRVGDVVSELVEEPDDRIVEIRLLSRTE